jgi:hypothetical protein
MFLVYFVASAIAILATFATDISPQMRLALMGAIGLTVFGVFGSFSFYLPELFPMRLRGTGSGFCYNAGRVITAAFPFGVGLIATRGVNPLEILQYVAFVPLTGVALLALGVGVETREPR